MLLIVPALGQTPAAKPEPGQEQRNSGRSPVEVVTGCKGGQWVGRPGDHPRSTPEDATAASYEVLHTLIGKQVTIRGTFSLRGKFGPYVLLGNQQVVYLVPRGSFTWGEPYSEMEGKLVAATGTLSFYHGPNAEPAGPAFARAPDYFYLEAETAHLRLISH